MKREFFYRRLNELGFRTYEEYLRGPHWADVKARFRASKYLQHCKCGSDKDLHLHHKTYYRIGHERLSDLLIVCRQCHDRIHDYEKATGRSLWSATRRMTRKKRKPRGPRLTRLKKQTDLPTTCSGDRVPESVGRLDAAGMPIKTDGESPTCGTTAWE